MRIDRTTVAGNGVLHHIVPRRGGRFGLLVDADNTRHLFTYEEAIWMCPRKRSCWSPTRPTRWPRSCTANRLPIASSHLNDACAN